MLFQACFTIRTEDVSTPEHVGLIVQVMVVSEFTTGKTPPLLTDIGSSPFAYVFVS